jgi:hypothetical protein
MNTAFAGVLLSTLQKKLFISTKAADSLIVRRAVERSPYLPLRLADYHRSVQNWS